MTEEKPKLKSCPFCGGEATLWWRMGKEKKFWFVQCPCCYSQSGAKEMPEEAVSSWNNRSGENK